MDKLFLLIDYIYPRYFFKKVRKEQIQLLYKQLTKFILLSESLVATGLVVALWSISRHFTLIYWLLCMYLFPGISRALLLIVYQKNKEKKSSYFWLNLFCLGVFFSGIGWGSVSIFILPDRETIYQFIGIMIIFGVTAAANNFYSPIFIVYTFFLILSFLPLSIWFFLQGGLYYLLSLMSLLYIGVMLSIA
ncbi:hypothetical protein [Legionella gresilensis]|uniref:hypothetical protein n=1 Tax=Legionella gresilensis TaxID=91823 RepID=UPI00104113B0|nr:hypothetical protein [Legionella gresilensis]